MSAPETGAALSEPALVVLVGVSGAGKSSWAAMHYRSVEIVSSDHLRAVLGHGENDRAATPDAMSVLEQVVAARIGRRITVVVDTLGLDAPQRRRWLALARESGLPAVAVVLDTPPALARSRNAARDRVVPAGVLTSQLQRFPTAVAELEGEGWDRVVRVDAAAPPGPEPVPSPSPSPSSAPSSASAPSAPSFVLQLSRYDWGDGDPQAWLRATSEGVAAAGFDGIALMDHLIQIPQVGRAWEPMTDPWVTLGLLAGTGLGLRLGPLVSPVTLRPAGVTAKAAATLDVLTGGRSFLGLGAGWWAAEHAGYGIPFPSATDRLDTLARTIETIRALWAPGTKAYAGERISLPETTAYPRPVGEVPILVGGRGARTLRIAADLADGVNVPSRPDELDRAMALVRSRCSTTGRDPAEVALTVLDVTVVDADRDAVAGHVARLHGRSTPTAWAARHQVGTVAEQVRRYAGLADRGVRTVFVALPQLRRPDDVAAFAPVIRALR